MSSARAAVPALIMLLLVTTGCTSMESAQVKTVTDFLQAGIRGDCDTAMALTTERFRAESNSGCTSLRGDQILEIRSNANSAFQVGAEISSAGGRQGLSFELLRINTTEWRIDSASGTT